jgi:hypothetical protein
MSKFEREVKGVGKCEEKFLAVESGWEDYFSSPSVLIDGKTYGREGGEGRQGRCCCNYPQRCTTYALLKISATGNHTLL